MAKRRGRRGKKGIDKKQNRRIKRIENVLRPELKDYVPALSSGASTGTGSLDVYYPFAMAQGNTSITRVGLNISARSLEVRMHVAQASTTSRDCFQWALLQDDGFSGARLTDASLRYDMTSGLTATLGGWNTISVKPYRAYKGLSGAELNKRRVKVLYESPMYYMAPFDHTADQTYQGAGASGKLTITKRFVWPRGKNINFVTSAAGATGAGCGTLIIVHWTVGTGVNVDLQTHGVFIDL